MQIFLFFYSILAFLLPITTKKGVPLFPKKHTREKIYSKSTCDCMGWVALIDVNRLIEGITGTGNDV